MTNSERTAVTDTADRTFMMERVFDAPRELVFAAWTKPEHLAQWWGPTGWTLPVCTLDFRPGGVWHYCMRSPTGEDAWGKATYHEIVPPERIVYTDIFSDADGNPIAGAPEMLITIEFAAEGSKTKVTSRAQFASVEDYKAILAMGMVEGLTQTWDRLAAYLAQ